MNAVASTEPIGDPPIREFNISNRLLDDRAALDAAWDRDGYWFFRDVLDKAALDRLRAVYFDVLGRLGVIETSRSDTAVYNGASLHNYPITMGGNPDFDPLLAVDPMRAFVAEPAIRAFFTKVFGDEPFWVPNTEYHAVPPNKEHRGSRFNFIHCDGTNNKGLPLRVCWIPVAPIDEATGGLTLAEGLHKPRMQDFPRPVSGIGQNVVPPDAWRRTRFEPGDVLIFSLDTPHSGLANRSDRYFRLSMDIRGMKKSANVPMIGKVAAIDANAVTLVAEDGKERTFRLSEDSFCRIWRGKLTGDPLKFAEIPQLIKVGDPVYVAYERENVVFMRPQH
jgi:ectoine hydroxylase-related dioxygenase (phytanoyl-CoA dioxygenase family)